MKSRLLLLVFLTGFITLFSSLNVVAGNPGGSKQIIDRMQKIRANQTTGTIDSRDMLKAQTQVNNLAEQKALSDVNLNWQPVGPNNAAGRTRTVLFSNKDASGATILTGGVSGGIWKSRNFGLTWHEMNIPSNEVLRVTSMTQTPGGTIYVATGESYCGSNQNIGTGIYFSDNDSTFSVIAGTKPVLNDPSSNWAYIAKLAVTQTGRVYAATNTGLKYSDNGSDWFLAKSGYGYNVVIGADGTIFADIDHLAYEALPSDPTTFILLSTGTPTTLPNVGVASIEFAIAPSNQSTIYASFANLAGGLMNVYRSTDKGTTWSVIFPGNSTYNPLGSNGCYANSLAVLPTDPNQIFLGGDNIWRGTQFQSTGNFNWEQVSFYSYDETFYSELNVIVPISQHQIVFRPNLPTEFAIASDDGISVGTITGSGVTFQHRIKNCVISQVNTVACNMKQESVMGGAVYAGPVYIPGGTVLNEPENMEQLYPEGYGGAVAWSLIDPTCVFFGTGAKSLPLIRSEDMGFTLSPTFIGALNNGGYTPVCYWEDFNFTPSVDSIMYIAKAAPVKKGATITLYSVNEKFPIYYTTPDSIPLNDTIKVKDVVQSRFFFPGIISGSGPGNGKPGIFMTKQALQFGLDPSWFRIGNVGTNDTVTCLTVSKDLGVFWAGTSSGKLFRLTNITHANDSTTANVDSAGCVIGHASFDSTVYAQFKNRYITSIAIGANNETVLVTLGNYGNTNYVYKTTDGLDATPVFTAVQGNLPAMPVYTGIFEMSNSNIAILGTDFGVFATNDITVGSPNWTVQNTGTGNVAITEIQQQTNQGLYYYRPDNYGDIYLSSYGRGIFHDNSFNVVLGTDPINPPPVAENRLKIQPNPFTNEVYISYKITKTEPVNVAVYDLSGRVVYTVSYGTQAAGNYMQALNLMKLTAGTYIVKLDYGTGTAYGKAVKVN